MFIRVKLEEKLIFFVLKRREKRFKCAAVCPERGGGRREKEDVERMNTHTYL